MLVKPAASRRDAELATAWYAEESQGARQSMIGPLPLRVWERERGRIRVGEALTKSRNSRADWGGAISAGFRLAADDADADAEAEANADADAEADEKQCPVTRALGNGNVVADRPTRSGSSSGRDGPERVCCSEYRGW